MASGELSFIRSPYSGGLHYDLSLIASPLTITLAHTDCMAGGPVAAREVAGGGGQLEVGLTVSISDVRPGFDGGAVGGGGEAATIAGEGPIAISPTIILLVSISSSDGAAWVAERVGAGVEECTAAMDISSARRLRCKINSSTFGHRRSKGTSLRRW